MEVISFSISHESHPSSTRTFGLRIGSNKSVKVGRSPKNNIIVEHSGCSWYHVELWALLLRDTQEPRLAIRDVSANGVGMQGSDEGSDIEILEKGIHLPVPSGARVFLPWRVKGGARRITLIVRVNGIELVPGKEASNATLHAAPIAQWRAAQKEPEPSPEPAPCLEHCTDLLPQLDCKASIHRLGTTIGSHGAAMEPRKLLDGFASGLSAVAAVEEQPPPSVPASEGEDVGRDARYFHTMQSPQTDVAAVGTALPEPAVLSPRVHQEQPRTEFVQNRSAVGGATGDASPLVPMFDPHLSGNGVLSASIAGTCFTGRGLSKVSGPVLQGDTEDTLVASSSGEHTRTKALPQVLEASALVLGLALPLRVPLQKPPKLIGAGQNNQSAAVHGELEGAPCAVSNENHPRSKSNPQVDESPQRKTDEEQLQATLASIKPGNGMMSSPHLLNGLLSPLPSSINLPSWVTTGRKLQWWSESQRKLCPVRISKIDETTKAVIVTFEGSPDVWKSVPFSMLGRKDCPLLHPPLVSSTDQQKMETSAQPSTLGRPDKAAKEMRRRSRSRTPEWWEGQQKPLAVPVLPQVTGRLRDEQRRRELMKAEQFKAQAAFERRKKEVEELQRLREKNEEWRQQKFCNESELEKAVTRSEERYEGRKRQRSE